MRKRQFYGKGIPKIDLTELKGGLIVIEGNDAAGCSTQVHMFSEWLERSGLPSKSVGLKESVLVGKELEAAKNGNLLCPMTMSLFYATDFVDQLERVIIPALRAGFYITCDRYIFTLMVRDIARGADPAWIKDVYSLALIPDLVCFLDLPANVLAERSFRKAGELDYWESGMDIQRSDDMYECFNRYQTNLRKEFKNLATEFKFEMIDGNRDPEEVHLSIQKIAQKVMKARKVE